MNTGNTITGGTDGSGLVALANSSVRWLGANNVISAGSDSGNFDGPMAGEILQSSTLVQEMSMAGNQINGDFTFGEGSYGFIQQMNITSRWFELLDSGLLVETSVASAVSITATNFEMANNATLVMEDDFGSALVLGVTNLRLDTGSTITMFGDSAINIASTGNLQAYASGVHMKGTSSFNASLATFNQIGMSSIFVLDAGSTASATFGTDDLLDGAITNEGELTVFGDAQIWNFTGDPANLAGDLLCDGTSICP